MVVAMTEERTTDWKRLAGALAGLPASAPEGRQAAVLVLLAEVGNGDGEAGREGEAGGDLEMVLTRRRDDLANHPGQISFPGGRVDPGETLEEAAVREAVEEVALDPASVEVLGRLPAFYIPPSRFWLSAVVARWHAPHPLIPSEREVAEIVRVRRSQLCDPERWRRVSLSSRGSSWAWQLDDDHLLWGATAIVTAVLLGLVDPDWSAGARLEDLPVEREVRPWEVDARAIRVERPPRLPGLPEVEARAVPVAPLPPAFPHAAAVEVAAAALGRAVEGLLTGPGGPVVVLAGHGGNGDAGRAAAALLAAQGADVHVIEPDGSDGPLRQPAGHPAAPAGRPAAPAGRPANAAGRLANAAGRLPAAAVVIDALVGAGLRGALAGGPLDLVLALRHLGAPIVSLDLPSGIHPADGMIGEAVSADVTIAVEGLRPVLFRGGIAPFVGDLYVLRDGGLHRVRGVPEGRWRE